MTPTINIYRPDGTVLMEAVVTKDGVIRESLMTEDCIALRWSSAGYSVLPEGAYITDDAGERYRLLAPYYPAQKNELKCEYSPEFLSRVMCWVAVPLFFYTYAADGETITSRESEWSLTATPGTFMSYFARVIEAETGERWTATVSDDIKLTTASVAFQSTDLLSGLNAVASAFGTEWRADKKTNTLHLGAAAHGVPVRLEVGNNVGVPSTTASREEYGNRYYVLGSSRNITQSYEGANVNNLVTRRLTLDPDKYPGGYIDTRPGLTKDEIVPRYLTFDSIYPRSALVAYDVRCRLVYRLNESGGKIQIGTTAAGDPIYDQYAIWYFKAKDKITGKQYLFDPSDLIERQTLSVSFLGGALNGRDFELTYHDGSKVVNTSDGTPIQVDKGDFEINFVEEGSYIIPAVTALVPADGDDLTLFNINMPTEYHASAYLELETAALEEIDRRNRDLNNYEVKSNPVVFYDKDPELTVGQKVIFVNVDGREIETRVLSIARKLDRPYEQTITLGNEVVKGAISEIKENVVNANTNLAVISQLQELNTAFTQAYTRAQQQLLENFAVMSQIWKLDEDGNVYTERNVYSYKDIVAGGKSDGLGGTGGMGGALNLFDLLDVELSDRVNGDLIAWNGAKWTNIRQSDITPDLTGYATEAWVKAQGYLTQHQSLAGYATQTWVEGKGYALASDLGGYLPLIGGTLTGPLTMGGAGVHRIYFKDAEHFIELDEDGFHFSHDIYSDGDIVAGGWQTPGEDEVPVVAALSDLTDVKLAGLAIGDLIQWNGTDWVNVKASELGIGGGAVDLSNYVTIDTAQEIKGAKTITSSLQVQQLMFQYGNEINATSGRIVIGYRDTPNGVNLCYNNTPLTYGSAAHKIWHAGNDGSGSGLDADMLDGMHASSFLTGMPIVAPTANFQDYMAGLKGINWRSGDTTLTYGAMRAMDAVLDVGNSYARFFRLMHNRKDGNLRFQGSSAADSAATAAWGTERTLLDTVNYASLIDARYVKKAGDEMSGALGQSLSPSEWINAIRSQSPNIGVDNHIRILLGKSNSIYNTGYFSFHYKGDASASNFISLGFWGKDEIFNVLANGNVGIGTTSPLDKVHIHGDGPILRISTAANDGFSLHSRTSLAFCSPTTSGFDFPVYALTNNRNIMGAIGGAYGTSANTLSYLYYGGTSVTSPAMVILPDKKIGIGTTAPAAAVHINASFASTDTWINALRIRAGIPAGKRVYINLGAADELNNAANIDFYYAGAKSTSNYLGFGFASNNELMVLLATGSLLLGTTTNSSGAKLHVAGTIYSTQESTTLSDRRVKSDIRTLPFRGALIPRTYIKDGRPSIGFIAQEVDQLYPELVNKGVSADALWSLNYQAITAVLAAQLNVHEDEITKLRRRMAQVENELKAYRRA